MPKNQPSSPPVSNEDRLPQNLEAERSILGAVLLENHTLRTAVEKLTSEDFFLDPHRRIFDRMVAMADAQQAIDLVTLTENLNRSGDLEAAGGPAYLAQLLDGVPRISNVEHYARIVRQKAACRRAARLGDAIVKAAIDEDMNAVAKHTERMKEVMLPKAVHSAVDLISFEKIEKRHLRFLWPGYLPFGRLIHLAGDSGEAKSPLSIDLIARITSGADWPDGTKNEWGPRSAILLAGEDDLHDTIRPRLELAGADVSRVYDARCSAQDGQKRHEILLALDRDTNDLVAKAKQLHDLALIVIDPISNYLGKVQMKLEEEVRMRLLMPLNAAAAELGACALTIGHLNRRERGTSPLQRIMGAAAFHGVARFIYFAGSDPDDEDKHAHVLVQKRGGNSPSLRYRTVAKLMTWDGKTSEVIQVEWRGTSEATSQDAVDPQVGSEKSEEAKIAQELIELLKPGRMAATEVQSLLKDAGHNIDGVNWTRVKRRAGGVMSKKFPGDHWYSWYLPIAEKVNGDDVSVLQFRGSTRT